MSREATGEVRCSSDGAYSTLIRTFEKRETFQLPTCKTKDEADERSKLLGAVAKRMRLADCNRKQSKEALTLIANASSRSLKAAMTVAEELVGGQIPIGSATKTVTFADVADEWTTGALHKRFPDHVEKLTGNYFDTVKARLRKGVCPLLGNHPVSEITRAECDLVMGQLPVPKGKKELSRETRRQYAALVNRVLNLAELAGYIDRNPLPRGWLPKSGPKKRFPIMYPTEDRTFLATTAIPLWARLYCGVLHREGPRKGEGIAFQRRDIDIDHQTVNLDENKTDHPRFWKLAPGVVEALEAWFELRGDVVPESPVFVDENGGAVDGDHLADKIRDWMHAAGLERADLYSTGPLKGQFGTHCFRRSMVTRNLGLGVNEDFVRRRTGHKSNELLKYRQGARAFAELDLGDVDPLVLCIPELSPIAGIQKGLAGLSASPAMVQATPVWPLPEPGDCHAIATHFVEPWGIEPQTSSMPFRAPDLEAPGTTENMLDREPTRPPSSPIVEPQWHSRGNDEPSADVIETALAEAITRASAAGAWEAVQALTTELRARREARAGVVALDTRRARRER